MKRQKMIIGVGLLASILFLGGCATNQPSVHNVDGRFFVGGDSQCVRYTKKKGSNYINCYNRNGQFSGTRRALNNQEIQMYIANKQMQTQREIANQAYWQRMMYANRPHYIYNMGFGNYVVY